MICRVVRLALGSGVGLISPGSASVKGARWPVEAGMDSSFPRYLRSEFAGGGSALDFRHRVELAVDPPAGRVVRESQRVRDAIFSWIREVGRNPWRTKPVAAPGGP